MAIITYARVKFLPANWLRKEIKLVIMDAPDVRIAVHDFPERHSARTITTELWGESRRIGAKNSFILRANKASLHAAPSHGIFIQTLRRLSCAPVCAGMAIDREACGIGGNARRAAASAMVPPKVAKPPIAKTARREI